MQAGLREQAIAVLQHNDRGRHTVPTGGLYPYQWNWDSAIIALGIAHYDRERAWVELESLLEGQWENGMVPHVIFRSEEPDYFPGPAVWRSGTEPASSGISQPPVLASCAWELACSGGEADLSRAAAMFDQLFRYHEWFHALRDPDNTGLVASTHPWETGCDNSPGVDAALDAVQVPQSLPPFQRCDLKHVDGAQRPTDAQYDRYITLLEFGASCGWDPKKIYRENQFLVVDPGTVFILLRADRDLLQLARHLGREKEALALERWIRRSEEGCMQMWNDAARGYCMLNLRTHERSPHLANTSFLAFYAGIQDRGRMMEIAQSLERYMQAASYKLASWDPQASAFDPKRYWRGPCWPHINYLVAKGLSEQGRPELAAQLRADTERLIGGGFYEYFDPQTGEGLGGSAFSWSAAIALEWQLGSAGSGEAVIAGIDSEGIEQQTHSEE